MNLDLDQIVVGERYRVVMRPTPEYTCPHCNGILGLHAQSTKLNGQIVTVTSDASGGLSKCGGCGVESRDAEGIYEIDQKGADGGRYVLPYTWLWPLDAPYDASAYVGGVDPGIEATP